MFWRCTLVGAEAIDGGVTIVLHMRYASKTSAAVLKSRRTAHALQLTLNAELTGSIPQDKL